MSIMSWGAWRKPGEPVCPFGRMFDADGVEIDEPIVRADLDTGEVTYQVRPLQEDGEGNLLTVTYRARPPLRFEENK